MIELLLEDFMMNLNHGIFPPLILSFLGRLLNSDGKNTGAF